MGNTLFFGNGLNYGARGSISWDDLLKELGEKYQLPNQFDKDKSKHTMFYEQVVLQNKYDVDLKDHEGQIKREIADAFTKIEPTEYIKEIGVLNFDNYMTTNYDYALKNSLIDRGYKPSRLSSNTESIYSIRRGMELVNKKSKKTIWNIHGEIDRVKSIMLGYDHYCGFIGKIDSYIKGSYSRQVGGKELRTHSMKSKLRRNSDFDDYSWIDLFFNTDVHIVGFGLSYSETDIW